MELDEHRRTRLGELVRDKYEGNEQLLGRALGYTDGSFIRQMMRDGPTARKITEKSIRKIESLPGVRGWFSLPVKSNSSPKLVTTVIGATFGNVYLVPVLTFEQLHLMESLNTDPRLSAAPRVTVGDARSPRTKVVIVNDDAMSPLICAGNLIHLDPDLVPIAGDKVLVIDAQGVHYVREYRVRAAGAFEATPCNPAYATLHSVAHGLRVVAVATYITQPLRPVGRS